MGGGRLQERGVIGPEDGCQHLGNEAARETSESDPFTDLRILKVFKLKDLKEVG